jgi:hypothetical protein
LIAPINLMLAIISLTAPYKEQKRDVNKRALNAWEASFRDVRDKACDNLLKIVDGGTSC